MSYTVSPNRGTYVKAGEELPGGNLLHQPFPSGLAVSAPAAVRTQRESERFWGWVTGSGAVQHTALKEAAALLL